MHGLLTNPCLYSMSNHIRLYWDYIVWILWETLEIVRPMGQREFWTLSILAYGNPMKHFNLETFGVLHDNSFKFGKADVNFIYIHSKISVLIIDFKINLHNLNVTESDLSYHNLNLGLSLTPSSDRVKDTTFDNTLTHHCHQLHY